jgi:hypothetical protein
MKEVAEEGRPTKESLQLNVYGETDKPLNKPDVTRIRPISSSWRLEKSDFSSE